LKYIYNGPLTSVNINVNGKIQEVILFPNKEFEIPDNNSWVKTQVAMKRLIPVIEKSVKKIKNGGKK